MTGCKQFLFCLLFSVKHKNINYTTAVCFKPKQPLAYNLHWYEHKHKNLKTSYIIQLKMFQSKKQLQWYSYLFACFLDWKTDIDIDNDIFCLFLAGRFGNGVVSYFIFLKWLMFLNLFLFVLVFGFVGIPTVVSGYEPATYTNMSMSKSTNSCTFGYPSERYAGKNVPIDDLIVDFITGQVLK